MTRRRRTWTKPANRARKLKTPIATFISHSRSAMWCSGPGKPTSMSSGSWVAGLTGWPWAISPRSSDLGLGHGIAGRDPEDDPERVEGGEQGADVAADREHPVHAAALDGEREDLVLGEEAGGERECGERQGADQQRLRGERQPLPEAAHLVDVLLVRHRRDHRAGRHEEKRLEEGVGHQVEHPRRVGADRDADDHVADLAHRRVGDDPLEVGDDERDRRRDQQRRQRR